MSGLADESDAARHQRGTENDHDQPPRGAPSPYAAVAVPLRVVRGSFFLELGPAAIWFQAHRPVVGGAALSPLMRAAMTADFCNGASTVLDPHEWTFINADLSINLARMPVGEWILLDAQTTLSPDGTGIAFAKLGDERGYFGRAAQSLVIEKRAK